MNMIKEFFRKVFPPPKAPKCIHCGHEPCPACETWCDMLVKNIYCPNCSENPDVLNHGIVRPLKDTDKGGDKIRCQCGYEWGLDLDFDDGDVGIDPCCDGKCEWDQPENKVLRWCAKARGE